MKESFYESLRKIGFEFLDASNTYTQQVFMAHHPGGGAKHISSFSFSKFDCPDGKIIHYLSTVPGSSGAPLINTDGTVFAMHKGSVSHDTKVGIMLQSIISLILNQSLPLDVIYHTPQMEVADTLTVVSI